MPIDLTKLDLSPTEDGCRLPVLVQPKAKKNELSEVIDGRLKIRLTSPPVDGKANQALIKFLAGRLGLAKSKLSLISGQKNRRKEVEIRGLSPKQVIQTLAASP